MDLFESLRILRRRSALIVLAVVAGAIAGWVSAPGGDQPVTYRATHTMIVSPSAGDLNLDQAALLAVTGAVPERVAAQLGLETEEVVGAVTVRPDGTVAALTVTGRDADRGVAEALADLTAVELVDELSGTSAAAYDAELDRLQGRVTEARERVAAAELQPGAIDGTNPAAAAELEAARSDLATGTQAAQGLIAQRNLGAPMLTVETARAVPDSGEGIQAPASKPGRALLLGAFGFLLGGAAAMAIDRLDLRLHTRDAAERAFGFPVVAEIPLLPRRAADELLAVTRPAAPFVEAHRALGTLLAFGALSKDGAGASAHQIIVVTSPLAGEGKTTTVAHLAAVLGEVGRSVLVVSGDLRRPRLHEYLERPREPGLTEALVAGPPYADLSALEVATDVPGVRFLPSGSPMENPGPMLDKVGEVLRAARHQFDFVLVDSPPLLAANDAAVLAKEADGVLLLARAGHTTIDAAERSTEILGRLDVPVIGIVFTATEDTPSSYGYYRNHYYTETEAPRRRLGRRRAAPEPEAKDRGRPPVGRADDSAASGAASRG